MNDRFAFGARAAMQERFYKPQGRPLLVVSADGAIGALHKAVELRTLGHNFDAAFLLEEHTTAQARLLGKELLRFSHDFDHRRNACELLSRNQLHVGGKPQSDFGVLKPAIAKTLQDVAALADRWLVQSWTEYRRIVSVLGIRRNAVRNVSVDDAIPNVQADASADAIVVWAPQDVPDDLAVLLFGLEELRRPTSIICRVGPTYGLKTVLISPDDCHRALARARVVIDASIDGPATALTFLSRGFQTIASRASGAGEYVPAMRLYDSHIRRTVFAAVSSALGERVAPALLPDTKPGRQPARVRDAGPRVSLIVRTHNRPVFLARALESVERQGYPNVEALVVNNGGDARIFGQICARFARARLISIPKDNIADAATRGLESATGTYAGLLDDDDLIFPDHVERLSAVLQRSGAIAAYADAMNIYLRTVADNVAVTGYAGIFVPALEPTTMHYVCQVVGSSRIMFDRQWVVDTGGFDSQFVPADDYEVWLRLIKRGHVARVNAITSLYTQFADRSNVSAALGHRYAAAHRGIYDRHPTGRKHLEDRRVAFVAELERFGGLGAGSPAIVFDPQPLLF